MCSLKAANNTLPLEGRYWQPLQESESCTSHRLQQPKNNTDVLHRGSSRRGELCLHPQINREISHSLVFCTKKNQFNVFYLKQGDLWDLFVQPLLCCAPGDTAMPLTSLVLFSKDRVCLEVCYIATRPMSTCASIFAMKCHWELAFMRKFWQRMRNEILPRPQSLSELSLGKCRTAIRFQRKLKDLHILQYYVLSCVMWKWDVAAMN